MSEQALLAWMQRLDAKVDAIRDSLTECQGRHRVAAAVKRIGGTRRAKLIKAAVVLATAGAGFLAERFLNN